MATLLKMNEVELDIFKNDSAVEPSSRPQSLNDLDVSSGVLEELALKTLYVCGSLSVLDLANKIRLSYTTTSDLFSRLRSDLLCQVTGMTNNIPQIAITSAGRTRAADLLSQNRYVGAAPVSFESYVKQVRHQSVKKVNIHAEEIARAFDHLVVDQETLRQLGTALNSGSSLFLYGPPGTGKTTYAEVLSRVLAEDAVWIPHAIEIDGQIITVYDPSIHKSLPLDEANNHDPRWELCERPSVLVGGELTAEMLDLQFNAVSKFYVGPVQMKANNGVLIIDDFGRQRLRPEELLNRWIVPLDRRIDFMTMEGGKKIEVPFEMLVVFASNLNPTELVDPAFIRRIKTKIRIGAVTEGQFTEIFHRVAKQNNVPFDANIPQDLINFIQGGLRQELRSCYPRDIVEQVIWAARYENKDPHIDRPSLVRAIRAYFPEDALQPLASPRA